MESKAKNKDGDAPHYLSPTNHYSSSPFHTIQSHRNHQQGYHATSVYGKYHSAGGRAETWVSLGTKVWKSGVGWEYKSGVTGVHGAYGSGGVRCYCCGGVSGGEECLGGWREGERKMLVLLVQKDKATRWVGTRIIVRTCEGPNRTNPFLPALHRQVARTVGKRRWLCRKVSEIPSRRLLETRDPLKLNRKYCLGLVRFGLRYITMYNSV